MDKPYSITEIEERKTWAAFGVRRTWRNSEIEANRTFKQRFKNLFYRPTKELCLDN